jgi:nitrogen fixation/metabolism regulation signal transduction histidine kinase
LKKETGKWKSIKGRIRHFDYKLSIRAKLTLILVLIPLVIMPFVAMSLHYNNISYNTIQGIANYSEITKICESISFLLLKIDGNLQYYTISRDTNYIKQAEKDIISLKEKLEKGKKINYTKDFNEMSMRIGEYSSLADTLKKIISAEEIPRKKIARGLRNYKEKYDKMMSRVLIAKTKTEKDSLMEEVKIFTESYDISDVLKKNEKNPNVVRITELLRNTKKNIDAQNAKILSNVREHIKELTESGEKYSSRGARNIWTVLIITLVFVIILIVVLPERIVIPIRRLSRFIQQVERGNLNVTMKGFPEDEIGNLVFHFSKMLNRMKRIDTLKTQKIHESERKSKFIIESVAEGVLVLNDELRILTWNKPVLTIIGIDSETIEQRSLKDIKEVHDLEKKVTKPFKNGEKIDDFVFTNKNGEKYLIKVLVLRDMTGKPMGMVILFKPQ